MVVLFSSRYNNLQLAPVAGPTNIWSNLPLLPPTKCMTSQETLPSSARRCGLNRKASAAMARISEAINQPRKRPEIAARALSASAARRRGTKYSLMDKTRDINGCVGIHWIKRNRRKQTPLPGALHWHTFYIMMLWYCFNFHMSNLLHPPLQTFPYLFNFPPNTPKKEKTVKQPETRIAILHRNLACVPFWNAEVVDAKVQGFLVQYRHLDRGLSSWLAGDTRGVHLEKHHKNHWKMSCSSSLPYL